MQFLAQNSSKCAYKKLHPQQKQVINDAVIMVCDNPHFVGQKKVI